MKNNKGFTLVELLAIVIILAIIVVTAAPNITNEITKEGNEQNKILKQKIDNAAHLYAAKYYADKIVNGDSFSINLNDLENDGLLDLNGKCNGSMKINNGKTYSPDYTCEQ